MKEPPLRGDLIEIHWYDVLEDNVGDPHTASLARRVSIGYFWEEKVDRGVPSLVTTSTVEKSEISNSGYCIYPMSLVSKINVIRRKRRKKEKNGPQPH